MILIFSLLRDSKLRQCLVWLLLLVETVALSGVIFLPAQPPSRSEQVERFPCEDCPCGCIDAAHCWDNCCCYTDEEKLQWAERNGVEPPDFLVDRSAAARASACPPPGATCCQCSGEPSSEDSCAQQTEPAEASQVGTQRMVVLWIAAKCRGLEHLWMQILCTCDACPVADLLEPPTLVGLLASFNECVGTRTESPDPPVP